MKKDLRSELSEHRSGHFRYSQSGLVDHTCLLTGTAHRVRCADYSPLPSGVYYHMPTLLSRIIRDKFSVENIKLLFRGQMTPACL